MDKRLEVKEFDVIIGNAAFRDNNNFKYLPKETFDDLLRFIHQFQGEADSADALEFLRIGYQRNVGETVTVKNYVGVIQMRDGYQIEILPKIAFSDRIEDGTDKTKQTFLHMLRCLKDFRGKTFNAASLKVDRMNLYEVFINMYLEEVQKLVKHGIRSGYVRQEENLRYYKGKLMVAKHIRENAVHKERFFVSYDEFHPNRPENRLIKATLLKLQKLTKSAENAKEIRQLLTAFEMVEPSVNYQKDFSGLAGDRNMADYSLLLPWSKVFLTDKSFTTFSGDDRARALLFPMEKVYEDYVAHWMKRLLPEAWDISTQDRHFFLFDRPREQFALRPDIVLKHEGRTVVLDTKWKRLTDNAQKNYGISQADMYQMYAYSKKYNAPEIWLLYPTNEEMRDHAPIRFTSNDGTAVNVFFVDVRKEEIEKSISELYGLILNQ